MPSEILESIILPLQNIAIFDNGRIFEAVIDTPGFGRGAFTKTLQEGRPIRPLLRADGRKVLGQIDLITAKGSLHIRGRMSRSEGMRAVHQPGVSLDLRYKVIHGDSVCTEARLFSVALANSQSK